MIRQSIYSVFFIITMVSLQAKAAVIQYEQINQTNNRYEYSYQVTNEDIISGIEEFSLYFDHTFYNNIEITASPVDWDPLVLQVDQALLADGIADWLTFSDPIALGETLIGFNVAFDFLGSDITQLLQAQSFEIFDVNFNVIDSGFVSNVPEPGSLMLFSLGIAICSRFISRSKSRA